MTNRNIVNLKLRFLLLKADFPNQICIQYQMRPFVTLTLTDFEVFLWTLVAYAVPVVFTSTHSIQITSMEPYMQK